MTTPRYDTILITGAAGMLGTELRKGLAPFARKLRLNDRVEIADLQPNEEAVICDLGDMAAVSGMVEGVDAIVHFGGASRERPWDDVLNSTIAGSYNIYESARQHGVKRIVFASSVHAIGFHKLESHIDATTPPRPDTLYGLSKCFVEDLSRLYWDKLGIETLCLRIFSSFPEPEDHRHLWSWLSFRDCVQYVTRGLMAPRVGHTIAFGMSDNRLKVVDDSKAGHIGYQPQDNTEAFRAKVEGSVPWPDPHAPEVKRYGGVYVTFPHPDDPA